MENISNQLSYLKGLVDGIKVDPESDYGRIFEGIINVLDEINNSVDDILESQEELAEHIDLIDEDLSVIEEELADDDFDDDLNDLEYYEIDCPNCGAIVCLDEDFFDTDKPVICPECGQEFDIDLDVDEDEDEDGDLK